MLTHNLNGIPFLNQFLTVWILVYSIDLRSENQFTFIRKSFKVHLRIQGPWFTHFLIFWCIIQQVPFKKISCRTNWKWFTLGCSIFNILFILNILRKIFIYEIVLKSGTNFFLKACCLIKFLLWMNILYPSSDWTKTT